MRRQTVAAALVLAGWILIAPPIDLKDLKTLAKKGIRFDPHAPISQWIQQSAHDTAAGCEDAHAAMPPSKEDEQRLSIDAAASFLAYKVAARCVPAEHLYPPRAPMPRIERP